MTVTGMAEVLDIGEALPDVQEVAQPLTDAQMLLMFNRVAEIHAGFKELEKVKDNLPQIIESMPPMVRMMFAGLIK